jgi:hypothetical protein
LEWKVLGQWRKAMQDLTSLALLAGCADMRDEMEDVLGDLDDEPRTLAFEQQVSLATTRRLALLSKKVVHPGGRPERDAARNPALLERVRALKSEHPFWGYRRI